MQMLILTPNTSYINFLSHQPAYAKQRSPVGVIGVTLVFSRRRMKHDCDTRNIASDLMRQ